MLIGRGENVKDGVLEVKGGMLHEWMNTIEANVKKMQNSIQKYIEEHPEELDDLKSRGLADEMEVEPTVPIPDCELNPLHGLNLAERNITSIIYCSGLALDFSRLIPDLPNLFDPQTGYPIQTDGACDHHPGLYFLGLHWMRKWKSAIMLGCADDALHVVTQIESRRQLRRRFKKTIRSVIASQRFRKMVSSKKAGGGLGSDGNDGVGNDDVCGDVTGDVQSGASASASAPNKQLTSAEASAMQFQHWADLLPSDTSENPYVIYSSVSGVPPLTYAKLKEFVATLGGLVTQMGIGPTDRLCVVIPNGPEAAVAFLGLSLFCTYAPLNPLLKEGEFEFEFTDLPAKAVVVMEGASASSSNAVAVAERMSLPIMELVPFTKAGSAGTTGGAVGGGESMAGLFTLRWLKNPLPPLAGGPFWPDRDRVALVLHTSGTTNKPKIVPLTHGQITCGALCIKSTLQLTLQDVCINIMPLFHIHGISVSISAQKRTKENKTKQNNDLSSPRRAPSYHGVESSAG